MYRLRRVFFPHIAESEFAENVQFTRKNASDDDRDRVPMPPRPSLPPTLGCALGMWAACATVLTASQEWNACMCFIVGVCSTPVALAACWALWHRTAVQLWAMLLGTALGAVCACGYAATQIEAAESIVELTGHWRFEVVEDSSSDTLGTTCFARCVLPNGSDAVVRLRLDEDAGIPCYGEVFEADATLVEPAMMSASYCWRKGVVADARAHRLKPLERTDALGVLAAVRMKAIEAFERQGGDGAAVAAALVCGWRGMLDKSDVYDDYKVTGLAHLVAVSGAHLSIVAAFIAALMRLIRAPKWLAIVLQSSLLLCYLVLAAAPPSAVRATIMTTASLLSFTAHRRPAALGALSLCMMGCFALAPLTALSASFALSALSTLGIVVFAGLCSAWTAHLVARIPRAACDALSLTLASSLGATPLSAALFSQLPLVAPIANVLVAPLFPLVCAGCLLAVVVSLIVPFSAPLLVTAASTGAGVMTTLVCLVAQLPYASVPADVPLLGALIVSALCAGALWLWWPRPHVKWALALVGTCLIVALSVFCIAPRFAGDEVLMLDVGQGDAFVVRSGGHTVLIDTGNQDRLLREALARQGVFHLDAIVLTHADDDHCGALSSLSGIVEVGQVLVARDTLTCDCDSCCSLVDDAVALVGANAVQGLAVGDKLHVGAFTIEVAWPTSFVDEGGNADSLVLVADADVDDDGRRDWRALFMGDAERDQLRTLLDTGAFGTVDILKVGHHGSQNALDEHVVLQLAPRIALVSAGEGNRYGHPAPETLAALDGVGSYTLRTDEVGDVSCELEADRVVVKTLR